MTWISTSILKKAREQLGLSPIAVEESSKKLGKFYTPIQAEQLCKWEEGSSEPNLEDLETLAELYVCPVGHFFLQEIPKENLSLSFRGLSSEKQQKLSPSSRQTLRRFFTLAEWTTHLIASIGVEWSVKIQPSNRSVSDTELDTLVQRERNHFGFSSEIRKQWHNSNQAFLWWRKNIEKQGVFCFQMKLEPGDIRGASTWFEDYPFILVNHQDVEAAAGRIFTLLHEYGHLLTSNEGLACDFRGLKTGENPEPFANKFAARMLLNYDEFSQRLKEIGKYQFNKTWADQILDEVRYPLFVSRDVVLIMLEDMNLAPIGLYQEKRAQWEKFKIWGRGGGGSRPTKKELKLREIGYSLGRVLTMSRNERNLPLDDLSYVLDMKVEKVPEFLDWTHKELQG
ncbi:MAG: XRE family transcriptional regulator [Bacteroidota bacterium]|nr:XRE family transcriptional regulator [Bacteroidota bacterium]